MTLAEALLYQREQDEAKRPFYGNPNLAAQGKAYRANITPPTSVMDPRYPAWKKSQDDAEAFMVAAELVGSAIPLVGPAVKGAAVLGRYAGSELARGLESYMGRTGMQLNAVPEPSTAEIRKVLGQAENSATEKNLFPKTTNEEILKDFWAALDNAGDGYIGVRSDDAVIKKTFRKSWNRPEGEKTTRLPGTSVIGVGYENITEQQLLNAIEKSRRYGKNTYLLEGKYSPEVQYLANDPEEKLMSSNKILSSFINKN